MFELYFVLFSFLLVIVGPLLDSFQLSKRKTIIISLISYMLILSTAFAVGNKNNCDSFLRHTNTMCNVSEMLD